MLLKILLFIFLDGYYTSCAQTERFLPSTINEKKLTSNEQKLTNKKSFLHTEECFNVENVTCGSSNEIKNVQDIVFKPSISQVQNNKQKRRKRFKLNGINLSGLVQQSYEFEESPQVKRDLYLYKEIFSPWEYSQLRGNYFNSPFFENRHIDENYGEYVREKRVPQNLYSGDSESQFTSDHIDEYINLKTGEKTKQKVSNLEKAFRQLEHDISHLAKLKSMTAMGSKSRNKLSLNPKEDNIEVNLRMPSNIEHLDREIVEEVVRVYVPKVSKSISQGPMKMVTQRIPVLQELLKSSIQTSLQNNKMENVDKKTDLSPIKNPIVSFNIKLNKTNQNGEYK